MCNQNVVHATGPAAVNLNTASNFILLTKTGLTNVGPSSYSGNIGASPITGAAITGLTCPEVVGGGIVYTVDATGPAGGCNVVDTSRLTTAVSDMTNALSDASSRAPNYTGVGGGVIGGITFAPGVYHWSSAVSIPADMTISGGANDTWIFQIDGALALGTGFKVNLTGGAQSKNVFWEVGGAITFAANSHFSGVMLASVGITMAAGATVDGRLLTQTAVTATQNTVAVYPYVPYVPPDTTRQINYTGRLLNAAGATVPDGNYNIQFKIYQDGDGKTVGNTGGTPVGALKWTENFLNSASQGVTVTNGFLSVQLGSLTGFGTSIDWNQGVLYLSMNIGGISTTCTSFSVCTPDGEMLPMKRLSAAPFAMNSGKLSGLSASSFLQLALGVQTDVSTNTSSIYINKTGTGNIITLQSVSNDAFSITNAGDVSFGSSADHIINMEPTISGIVGKALTISAGSTTNPVGTGANGGALTLQGGNAGGTTGSNNGGSVTIIGGSGSGAGVQGLVNISASVYTAATNAVCASSCTLTQSNVDGFSTIIAGASASGVTMTVPAPTNVSTAGRIIYITSVSGSSDFTLTANSSGNIVTIGMRQNLTATLIWNGSAWTSEGATSATTLQNGYNNSGTTSSITLTDGKDLNVTAQDTATDPNVITNLQCVISCGSNGRFAVQNVGVDVLSVAPNNGGITLGTNTQIGSATTDSLQVNFQLDSSSALTDAGTCSNTSLQGVMYYNTTSSSIRACVGGAWSDLSNPDSLGLLSFGVIPSSGIGASAYDLPSLVTTGVSGPCKVSWATTKSVSIQPCVAYSGGKRVNVTATTLSTNSATTNNINLTATTTWGHICLTGTGGQPAFTTTAGQATPNASASLPVFSVTAPILCLADVVGSVVTAGQIANLYDVRTFSSTLKEAVNASTAVELGTLADAAGTAGAMTPATAASQRLYGLVVSTNGSTSVTAPNAIVTTSGPGWVKATSGTAGQIIQTGTTSGYATTITTVPVGSSYFSAGVTRSTYAATCTTTSNCNGSLYVNFAVR